MPKQQHSDEELLTAILKALHEINLENAVHRYGTVYCNDTMHDWRCFAERYQPRRRNAAMFFLLGLCFIIPSI